MDMNALLIRKALFPLLKHIKGNKTLDYIINFQKTQFLSDSEMRQMQEEKLKKLLLHCVNNIPAYEPFRKFIPQIKESPLKVLGNFPILTKAQVNRYNDILISPSADKSKLIPNRSGGSTGEPVRFYIDRPTSEASESARWRSLLWWDIKIGDKCLMVWGSPLELSSHQKRLYNLKERYLKNIIFISAYSLNSESIHTYINMLNREKPTYFYGYASALYLLAQLILQKGVRIKHTPKAIVSTAETLYDYQRETIEKTFRCKVVNEYGARDAGVIAYECPEGKMHINSENMIIETVDVQTRKRVKPGTSGLVIITDLNNYSMPRLRYQLGDVAVLSAEKCSCGVNLPIIEKVEGREDDIFVATNGSYVHGVYFCNLARSYPSIKQFQIIQRTLEDVSLKIIKSDSFKEDEVKYYMDEIYNTMGKINIHLEYVDKIDPAASGKIRYSKRDFPISV